MEQQLQIGFCICEDLAGFDGGGQVESEMEERMMNNHRTQELVTKEEISFLVSKNCSPALLGRLLARIARRHGRPRRRMPTSRSDLKSLIPDLNEAA